MKHTLLTTVLLFILFNSYSQDIENIYYDKFILVEKTTNEIVEVLDIQTTLSFNTRTKVLSITSPVLVERFYVNDTDVDFNYFYFLTTCIDHDLEILMAASSDGQRFILYDFDKNYYYIFLNE